MPVTDQEFYQKGDARWRKIEDCDTISEGVEKDVSTLKTDVAVVKAILKGILAVSSIMAGAIIPACLKIIFGG